MAVSNQTVRQFFTGNGSTTVFSFIIPFRAFTDISVLVGGVLKTYNSDYTMTGTLDAHTSLYTGGVVTFSVAPGNGVSVEIYRTMPAVQSTDYEPDDSFAYNSHEAALDVLTMLTIQLFDKLSRSIMFPEAEMVSAGAGLLPSSASRANTFIGFDASGNLVCLSASLGRWRGNYAAATSYTLQDFFKDTVTGNIYIALNTYVSVDIATDLAGAHIALLIQAPTTTLINVNDYAADGGVADAYAVTLTPDPSVYTAGLRVSTKIAHDNTGACTLNVNAHGVKNIKLTSGSNPAAGQIKTGMVAVFEYDGTNFQILNPISVGTTTSPGINPARTEARLTLTASTAIPSADVTAAGTLRWTPFRGKKVAVPDGAGGWLELNITADLTKALTLTSGKNYDWFAFNNAGVLDYEPGAAWTNDTTRAEALTLVDGVYVKAADTTRKYIGTIRASGANVTEDSKAKRFVWNYWNRTRREMLRQDTTAFWDYATGAAFHQANASAANQVEYVCGLDEDMIEAEVNVLTHPVSGVGGFYGPGIGIDSSTVNSAQVNANNDSSGSAANTPMRAKYSGRPGIGYHAIKWLENGVAACTCRYFGQQGNTQSGLMAVAMC